MENKTKTLSNKEQKKIVELAKKEFQKKLEEGQKILENINKMLAKDKAKNKD